MIFPFCINKSISSSLSFFPILLLSLVLLFLFSNHVQKLNFVVLHRQWNHSFPIRTWIVYQVYAFSKYWGPGMCQILLEDFCTSVCETKTPVSVKLIILESLWFSWLFNWWSHHDKVRYFSSYYLIPRFCFLDVCGCKMTLIGWKEELSH